MGGLRNKLEELKLLMHDTHADIITIQEASSPIKPKHSNYITSQQCAPTGCTKQEVGSLHSLETTSHSLTDIPSTINTHNTELQMVKVHINNTKHITIANIYIPPRNTTSTHCKTADTDMQHSLLTGDVGAHSTL